MHAEGPDARGGQRARGLAVVIETGRRAVLRGTSISPSRTGEPTSEKIEPRVVSLPVECDRPTPDQLQAILDEIEAHLDLDWLAGHAPLGVAFPAQWRVAPPLRAGSGPRSSLLSALAAARAASGASLLSTESAVPFGIDAVAPGSLVVARDMLVTVLPGGTARSALAGCGALHHHWPKVNDAVAPAVTWSVRLLDPVPALGWLVGGRAVADRGADVAGSGATAESCGRVEPAARSPELVDALTALARRCPSPSARGVLVLAERDDPNGAGERPYRERGEPPRAEVLGISEGAGAPMLARAALASLSFQARAAAERLTELTSIPVRRVVAIGGLGSSVGRMQAELIADQLQLPVEHHDEPMPPEVAAAIAAARAAPWPVAWLGAALPGPHTTVSPTRSAAAARGDYREWCSAIERAG